MVGVEGDQRNSLVDRLAAVGHRRVTCLHRQDRDMVGVDHRDMVSMDHRGVDQRVTAVVHHLAAPRHGRLHRR